MHRISYRLRVSVGSRTSSYDKGGRVGMVAGHITAAKSEYLSHPLPPPRDLLRVTLEVFGVPDLGLDPSFR